MTIANPGKPPDPKTPSERTSVPGCLSLKKNFLFTYLFLAALADRQIIDAFELWCWRRLLRVPWTTRRSNQSILKEISPEYSLEGGRKRGQQRTRCLKFVFPLWAVVEITVVGKGS